MKTPARLACIAALAILGACAGAPATRHITLDDGRPLVARSSLTPGIAVVRASVPDRIDRPQLVLRSESNHVALSEQYRWAEPLRRQIPRLIANDLGELLDSSRIAALSAEDAGFAVDFKLALDFQQLDAIIGQGVDVDVLWRLEPRSGKSLVGRSSFRQALSGAATDQPALVAAQRQALRRVAAEIAKEVAAYPTH
jgi:uncharacterized lipoprotein YmbA